MIPLALFSFGLSGFGQTVVPSVVNFSQRAKEAALITVQAEVVIPDYSTKKERKPTLIELPAGTKIIPSGFSAPIGSSPKPAKINTTNPDISTQAVQSFQGIADESYLNLQNNSNLFTIPPDVGGTVGTDNLMAVANNKYRILSKSGVEISKLDAQVFWQGTTGYAGGATQPYGAGDPHVQFDAFANRWIMVAQTNLNNLSSVLVGVSQTSNPAGNWNRYLFRADPSGVAGFDFPLVGYNADWIVISGNMFPVAGGSATNSQLYIFNKADMYAGAAISLGTNAQLIQTAINTTGGWISPVTPNDNTAPANTMYLLQPFFTSGGNGVIKLSTITGTLPNVLWNNNTANFAFSPLGNFSYFPAGNVLPQKGESRFLAGNDGRFSRAILQNGRIWAAHHVALSTPSRVSVQWWQLNSNGSVVQNGRIDDPTGRTFRAFPSIAVNSAEDAVIGYSIASAETFVSAAYSVKKGCGATNQMAYESIFKEGESTYLKNFGGSSNRWGDYSYTSLDPSTGRFWTIQQYAAQRVGANDNDSRWGTWWAEVQPQADNALNFSRSYQIVSESDATTLEGCRKYKDITIDLVAACKASGNATASISFTGTSNNNDFTILNPSLSFVSDDSRKTATIRVYDDNSVEGTESITLSFRVSGGGAIKGTELVNHTIYILDNDVVPTGPTFGTIAVGSANNSNTNTQPFNGVFNASKTQMLYTATELRNAGLKAGPITKIGFDIAGKGTDGAFAKVVLKVKSTSNTALSGNMETGLTTVYATATYSTVVGANDFVLQTPFNWDGTSSIVVEFCFENSRFALGSADTVRSTVTSSVRTIWQVSTSLSCDNMAGTISDNFGDIFLRPVLRLEGQLGGISIASSINNGGTAYFGPNSEIYVYDNSNQLLARLLNTSTHDYGCTQITVDREGVSASLFWNNNNDGKITNRTVKVIPTTNNFEGPYEITLYYQGAEVSGWQNATGRQWSEAQIVKTVQPISTYSPGNVPVAEVSLATNLSKAAFGSGFSITGQFSSGFSGFAVGVPGTPLPVSWLAVSGSVNNGNAILRWSTASEINNRRFDIEISQNGIDFTTVGAVAGAGTTTLKKEYVYTHFRPTVGLKYYRIKQVDNDGHFSYSKIIPLQITGSVGSKATIYPIPSRHSIYLSLSSPIPGGAEWQIYSADLKLLMQGKMSATVSQQSIDINRLAKGTYVLQVNTKNGVESLTFVKE